MFSYYNVEFKRYGDGHLAYVHGDITNDSGKDYNTAAFKISVFGKDTIMWAGTFKIRGLKRKQTKSFQVTMEGFDASSLPAIARYEISFDGGY